MGGVMEETGQAGRAGGKALTQWGVKLLVYACDSRACVADRRGWRGAVGFETTPRWGLMKSWRWAAADRGGGAKRRPSSAPEWGEVDCFMCCFCYCLMLLLYYYYLLIIWLMYVLFV